MSSLENSCDISLTRLLDADVKRVWDAWVDPVKVAQWWGPRGFTLTNHRKDVRTGGEWQYVMHGPDGTHFPNHTKYLEVDLYKRMVYDHGAFEDKPPLFRVTVNFTALEGKTLLEMTMTLPTPEAAAHTRKFVKKAGGDATWDRLAEFLEKESSGKEIFVINRSFKTSVENLFSAWTDSQQVMRWTAPVGFAGHYFRADIKVGGESFYSMTGSDFTLYGKAHYLEIEKPRRLVYTQIFVDKDEKISRHPMAPTWPETMKTTVTYFAEGPEQSRVCVTWEVFGLATQAERDTFTSAKAGMTQGWTGSFDKLEDHLEKKS